MHIPPGVTVKREVWKGSTFQADRKVLPLWKNLIDEHRRLHRELTEDEKNLETETGKIVLKERPHRMPIEGETVFWGVQGIFQCAADVAKVRKWLRKEGIPVDPIFFDKHYNYRQEHEVPLPVVDQLPAFYPDGGDPLASSSEEEDENHL